MNFQSRSLNTTGKNQSSNNHCFNINYVMEEKFEIKFGDEILEVVSNEDGSFAIHNTNGKICDLNPEIRKEGTVWTSVDLITPNYVEQLGELIESHYL